MIQTMLQTWIGTLIVTMMAMAAVMFALSLGALLGRAGPSVNCGRGLGGTCPCDPSDPSCKHQESGS
jgi:hypothetical protein